MGNFPVGTPLIAGHLALRDRACRNRGIGHQYFFAAQISQKRLSHTVSVVDLGWRYFTFVESCCRHWRASGRGGHVTAWDLPGGHQLFWLIPVGCVYTCLAIRLGFEFRHCRIAMGGLITAWLVICVKGLLLFGYQLGIPNSLHLVLRDGSTPAMVALLGCVFLWYARHVLLDIEGRLPMRTEKKKTIKGATESSRSVTPPQPTTAQPKGRSDLEPNIGHRAAELVEESVYTSEESEDEEPTRRRSKDARKRNAETRGQAVEREEMLEHRTREQQRKISKAERKRRRKLKAKERHAA